MDAPFLVNLFFLALIIGILFVIGYLATNKKSKLNQPLKLPLPRGVRTFVETLGSDLSKGFAVVNAWVNCVGASLLWLGAAFLVLWLLIAVIKWMWVNS